MDQSAFEILKDRPFFLMVGRWKASGRADMEGDWARRVLDPALLAQAMGRSPDGRVTLFDPAVGLLDEWRELPREKQKDVQPLTGETIRFLPGRPRQ